MILISVSIENLHNLNYASLKNFMYKAVRKRSWTYLNQFEKSLYRCALEVTKKTGRKIMNVMLLAKLISIVLKMMTPIGFRLRVLGIVERDRLLKLYLNKGVFKWIPKMRNWIIEPEYILQLGLKAATNHSRGLEL